MSYNMIRLLNSTQHVDALHLIERLRQECSFISLQPDGKPYLDGLNKYLDYMVSYWMPAPMWGSWSRKGCDLAAGRLKIPLEGVLPTTNHLESLNGALKRKYIPQWQHSGHRLRFDMLLYHLVSSILPQIYAQQRMVTQYAVWKARRFRICTPNHATGPGTTSAAGTSYIAQAHVPYAWYAPDIHRDANAKAIFASHKLHPIPSARPHELWARCASVSNESKTYWLTSHPSGAATCTCPDWLRRGGACKHMRAFRLLIEHWIGVGQLLPNSFHFPGSAEEAESVEARNRAWYGAGYDGSVTSPSPVPDATGPGTSDVALHTSISYDPLALPVGSAVSSTSESTLPHHLESARKHLQSSEHTPQLLPPTHPLVGTTLEMEAERVSEVMRLSGDSTFAEPETVDSSPMNSGDQEQVCLSLISSHAFP